MPHDETTPPPDPDPDRTPGLEPGGGVPAGETPPESGEATRGVAHTEKATARPAKWVWWAVILLVVLLMAGFFVTRALDLLLW
ncbi:DUF6480 family protein [Saccharopolyspora gregorii]|uniref:DUF6480 family protein n=1 Tax=Saccharopolyspora gregorii TaxID=33914 RepID=A0ABP6RRF5_9PSEU|nr:DUF6480 family protein [Saccharopolyspora gregorii]